MKWGVISTGAICNDFTLALKKTPKAVLHAVASRKRRREKSEALEAENASLKAENDALRAEVQRLRVQNARLVDPVSVNAAAAIVSDASGPLADENAAAWLGMSA